MLIKAYGKINISLDAVDKREDGYHLLEMIMQQIELYDEIDINRADEGITITCNKYFIPTDEKNLAYKAADLFMKTYNINEGVRIHIEKNIPVAAGLAGGSTDAAAVFKGMRDIFKVKASDEELMKLGESLGADIPYCFVGGTAFCEGIGEIITPLKPFNNKILVLVKPNFGVSTKTIFKELDITKINKHVRTDRLLEAVEKDDLKSVCYHMKNVLENVTIMKHKSIKSIKKKMVDMGAINSMMSGSGPTVFGFFEDILKAQRCYEEFKKDYKEVFITRTVNK
ncbi:4-(cytidine 5'-diphospho)-2-C-methyl-D-erythritol kinase [Oceanirhabdus sp. W0125-5]|uniref:4-(cytidine 5'-diphospho)-2-C-methyl-D-erythritol kinase n=1 Tax=Oceanirhabdus sp. W0125-5 TaxID=2999116 RepID=UPI0022F30325|nr:4-(cytidine 5'-diphospho)-2-C-methyl-D-erythritol kinase [Oceanirhabdus sp. W0125-5]WBW98458.1 4-(cytidine 5'-diphospho)-2-C-methyl-D-erythritol kinase [Oceanirhabdus sp. W0125-5]